MHYRWRRSGIAFAVAALAAASPLLSSRRAQACAAPPPEVTVLRVVPEDGEEGVPVDVQPRVLLVDGWYDALALTLRTRDGTAVAADVLTEPGDVIDWEPFYRDGPAWRALAPVAPLEPFATYVLELSIEDPTDPTTPTLLRWSFTTGDTMAPPPPPGPTLTRVRGDFHRGQGTDCLKGDMMALSPMYEPGPAEAAPFWVVRGATVPPGYLSMDVYATPGEVYCLEVTTRSLSGALGPAAPPCCFYVPADCDVPEPSDPCLYGVGAPDFDLACGDVTPTPPPSPAEEEEPRPGPAIERPSRGCAVTSSHPSSPAGESRTAAAMMSLGALAVAVLRRGRRAQRPATSQH